MDILMWNSPFISQGNVHFFYNCFKKTLIPQGNALSDAGNNVDIIITETTKDCSKFINSSINKIFISNNEVINMIGNIYDPCIDLYKNGKFKYNNISNILFTKLKSKYDVILLWENPVPFIEKMYQEALIIHQMPGVFCRPPYPNFTTFDVYGLYKYGTLFNFYNDIINFTSKNTIIGKFYKHSTDIFNELNIFKEKFNIYRKRFDTVSLLPLQVSAHYAFKSDSHYSSQVEFLMDVVRSTHQNEGLIVTQYVTPNTYDTIMNDKLLKFVNSEKNNIIWEPLFDNIDSVSQYMVPFVDKVYSVSSSLMFQSFLWNKETCVVVDSCMKPYDTKSLSACGVNSISAQKNTLDFFLNRHQVLADSLLDAKFISSLIEELVYRKKNRFNGIERYTDFMNIDKNYNDKILSSFRKGRSIKNIKLFFPDIVNNNNQINKINKIIKDEEIKIVSFDIFDTLISRVLEKPVDLFRFLQEKCFIESNGKIDNFSLLRIQAENESRNDFQSHETTLDAIYSYIERKFFIDKKLLTKIKSFELEYEELFSTAHPLGYEIFHLAKNKGKRIILVSDMYLPKHFIEKLLEKNGYSDYEKLYISCELGLSKREGDIYPFIAKDCHVQPSSILHFGDNKKNDIEMAKKANIKTYYLCNAITRMRVNKSYSEIFPPRLASDKARAACVGLIALKNFSRFFPVFEKESLFLGSTYLMGYNALGMILMAYTLWLARQARELGISKLYFLSREGWLIQQVYNIVAPYIKGAPESRYLYASRRTLNVAIIEEYNDIIIIASLPFTNGSVVYELIKNRFGVEINEYDTEYCFKKLEYNIDDRVLFIHICQSISEKILDNAKKEREGYLKYLENMECYKEDKLAIVDIGWKARMQNRLGNLLKKKITGFYFGTIVESELSLGLGNDIHTFLPSCSGAMSSFFVIKNKQLCETLMCCSEKSLEYITWNDGKLIKHFVDEDGYNIRKTFIQELHSGCIDFASDFTKYFHSFFETMFIYPELSTRVLEHFSKNALPLDLDIIRGVTFDDKVGGISHRSITELINKASAVTKEEKNSAKSLFDEKKSIMPAFEKNKPVKIELSKERNLAVNNNYKKTKFEIRNILKLTEKNILSKFLSKRKYNKYLKDRDIFFNDSHSKIAKIWYNIIK